MDGAVSKSVIIQEIESSVRERKVRILFFLFRG